MAATELTRGAKTTAKEDCLFHDGAAHRDDSRVHEDADGGDEMIDREPGVVETDGSYGFLKSRPQVLYQPTLVFSQGTQCRSFDSQLRIDPRSETGPDKYQTDIAAMFASHRQVRPCHISLDRMQYGSLSQ